MDEDIVPEAPDFVPVFTKTETVRSCQSLTCLLQALCRCYTTIELRNELVVLGTISHVDSNMNTTVEKATLKKLNGEVSHFDELVIQGKQIRYVHIPEGLNVMETIQSQCAAINPSTAGQKLSTGQYRRKRMRRARLNRQLEEKAAARAHKLGKGRSVGASEKTVQISEASS